MQLAMNLLLNQWAAFFTLQLAVLHFGNWILLQTAEQPSTPAISIALPCIELDDRISRGQYAPPV